MGKYMVKVIWEKIQAIEVEADSPEQAREKALDIPETEWATQEEIVDDEVEEVEVEKVKE